MSFISPTSPGAWVHSLSAAATKTREGENSSTAHSTALIVHPKAQRIQDLVKQHIPVELAKLVKGYVTPNFGDVFTKTDPDLHVEFSDYYRRENTEDAEWLFHDIQNHLGGPEAYREHYALFPYVLEETDILERLAYIAHRRLRMLYLKDSKAKSLVVRFRNSKKKGAPVISAVVPPFNICARALNASDINPINSVATRTHLAKVVKQHPNVFGDRTSIEEFDPNRSV